MYYAKMIRRREWVVHSNNRPVCAVNTAAADCYILRYNKKQVASEVAASLSAGNFAEGYTYFSIPDMQYWAKRPYTRPRDWEKGIEILHQP